MKTLRQRVDYAEKCFLSGNADSRKFDACFEMRDGDLVVTHLILRARQNPALELAMQRRLSPKSYQEWLTVANQTALL